MVPGHSEKGSKGLWFRADRILFFSILLLVLKIGRDWVQAGLTELDWGRSEYPVALWRSGWSPVVMASSYLNPPHSPLCLTPRHGGLVSMR